MSDLTQVDIEQRDDVVVARLTGELDISVAASTGQKIADAVPSSARGVVVDMAGLEFMDSSGVSMLFSLARQVGSHRQQMVVVAPRGQAGLARASRSSSSTAPRPSGRTWTPRSR